MNTATFVIVTIVCVVLMILVIKLRDKVDSRPKKKQKKDVYTINTTPSFHGQSEHKEINASLNEDVYRPIPRLALSETEQEKYCDFLIDTSDVIYSFLKKDFPCFTENKYILFDSVLFCEEIVKFKFSQIEYDCYLHGLELSDIKKIGSRIIYRFENDEKKDNEESFELYEEFVAMRNKRENELSTLFQQSIHNDLLNIKPIIGKFSVLCLNESNQNGYAKISDSLLSFSAERMMYYSSKARELFDYTELMCNKFTAICEEYRNAWNSFTNFFIEDKE